MMDIMYKGHSLTEIHNLTCEWASLVDMLQCYESFHGS